jgi:hypothetical protein
MMLALQLHCCPLTKTALQKFTIIKTSIAPNWPALMQEEVALHWHCFTMHGHNAINEPS